MLSNGLTSQSKGRLHSGLRRSFSAWAAFLFGVHCISLSSSGFIPYSWVASVWPGASIIWVLTTAAICCAFHAVAYAIIGSTVPKTGADYVLTSRVFPHALSFATSWTLVVFSGVVAGGLAAWVPKSALPALLRPLAILLNDQRYAALADFSTSPLGSLLIGGAILFLVAMTVARSNTFIQRLLATGFVLAIIAWGVIVFSLASADSAEFAAAWNRFMGPTGDFGHFDARVPLAVKAGMEATGSTLTATLAGLIMGFWIFYGYYIPTFFSEEIRSPARSLLISSLGSLAFSYLVFIVGTLLLQRLVPLNWIAAEGYLFNNPAAVSEATGGATVVAMPWITFYAGILQPKAIFLFIVAFAWIFTLINLVQTYFFYSSRIIFSWSLDRVMPDWILGRDLRDPKITRSLLVMTLLAIVGLADSSFGGPLGTQLTFVFFAVVTQLLPITALTLLPHLSPDLYARVPAMFRRKIAGIPLVSLVGGATFVYLVWMIIASFLYPAVGVASPRATLLLLVALVGAGLVLFAGMQVYRRRQGIDLRLTYRSLAGVADEPGPSFD